ncbi:subclass B1 metallo-beta-lactamase [Taibaiella sp. KBW10]|nr:subclass B1 metallo-beta-lactamase [Taibaiella sp. KBW10]
MRFVIIMSLLSLGYVGSANAQALGHKLEISHLTGDFYVYTTYQKYGDQLFPSNSMYLVTKAGAVLFDVPWDSTQFQPLLDSIAIKHHQKVVLCLATHYHEDRTGALEFYKQKGIKTYTTRQTDLLSQQHKEHRAQYLMDGDTTFTIGQYTFQTYYAGAGHSADNIVVWFPKEKILYGGCLIKSVEAKDLGNLSDAHVGAWAKTIKKIQHKFPKPKYIITGHQDWTDTRSMEHTLYLIKQYQRKQQ